MAASLERTRHPGIYKRGSRYVVVWTHRGRQHKESFRTMEEAREAQGRRRAGDRRPTSRATVGEYFGEWIETYAGRTARGFSETTRPEYRRPIEAHALPRWKTWRLSDVEPADVRELFGAMRKEEATTAAIRKLRAALSAMFATAVDDGLVRANPVQGVRIPAAVEDDAPTDDRAKALTRAELRLLLTAVPDDWQLFIEFLVHTGLRISEATGLRWEHVDLGDHPAVHVREQFYRGKRRRVKTAAARREIPLSVGMATRLRAHRRDTFKGSTAPVFPSKTGTPLIAGKVRERVLWPAAIAVGLSEEVEGADGKPRTKASIGFHSFRHTCASLLFDAGRNVKQVQEWLGHADPGFTLRTYVHLMDAGVGDADLFDEALKSGKGVATSHPETAASSPVAATHQIAA